MRVTRFAVDSNGRAMFPDYFIVDSNGKALATYSANLDTQEIADAGFQFTPWLFPRWPGRTVSFNEWRTAFTTVGYSFPQYHQQIGDRVRTSELVNINRAFVELFMNGVDLNDPKIAETHRELLTEQNVDLVDFLAS